VPLASAASPAAPSDLQVPIAISAEATAFFLSPASGAHQATTPNLLAALLRPHAPGWRPQVFKSEGQTYAVQTLSPELEGDGRHVCCSCAAARPQRSQHGRSVVVDTPPAARRLWGKRNLRAQFAPLPPQCCGASQQDLTIVPRSFQARVPTGAHAACSHRNQRGAQRRGDIRCVAACRRHCPAIAQLLCRLASLTHQLTDFICTGRPSFVRTIASSWNLTASGDCPRGG
jgi:hypothetical protein